MLASLSIRDFAIVDRLELELDPGFTVLTGETGAGKSVVVGALTLLLGARSDADLIKHGAQRAEIAASFDLEHTPQIAQWLKDRDLDDAGECIVRRTISRESASRGFINGRPASMQTLRALGELLIDVHGQHEHQSLMRRAAQRQILDDYAGLEEPVRRLAGLYRSLKVLSAQRAELEGRRTERAQRLELLRHQQSELESAELKPGEYAELEVDHKRLAHTGELLAGMRHIAQVLYEADEGTVTGALTRAGDDLARLTAYDPQAAAIAALLEEARVRVDEAARELRARCDHLEHDPQQLQRVEQRLELLHDLARKYRVEPGELATVVEACAHELKELGESDARAEDLARELEATRAQYDTLAQSVSAERREAAARLGHAVTEQMQDLGMAAGRFEVALQTLSPDEVTAYGLEKVEFLATANPDQPPRPLAKVASGGELSRLSLAVQTVTAAVARIPTLVFDEVDAGIGGRVAEMVGHRLRALGQRRQVLCITHLAQVAAQGEHQLQVVKDPDGGTRVRIRCLEPAERVTEIARMLGGIEVTERSRAHAREMLERAAP